MTASQTKPSFQDNVVQSVELLRTILKSKTGSTLYLDDPSLYDKIVETVEEFEYILSIN